MKDRFKGINTRLDRIESSIDRISNGYQKQKAILNGMRDTYDKQRKKKK